MEKLQRDVRLLKAYAFFATLLLVILMFAGFRKTSHKTKFSEIDVERINIVERDGKLKIVISNGNRQRPGVVDVDAQGAAKLEFLDEKGNVIQRLPAIEAAK